MRIGLSFKLTVFSVLLVASTTAVLTMAAYKILCDDLVESEGQRARHIASTAALMVDGDLHGQIKGAADADSEAFKTIQAELRRVQKANGLGPVYTFRQGASGLEFVAMTQDQTYIGDAYDPAKYGIEGVVQSVFDTGKAQKTPMFKSTNDSYVSGYGPIRNSQGEVVGLVAIDVPADHIGGLVWSALQHLLFLGSMVLLGAVLLGFLMVRRIAKPVVGTIQTLQSLIEERDLTRRIEVRSRDEIGEMARWFNTFIESIHEVFKDVNQSAEVLGACAGDLCKESSQLHTGAQAMTERSVAACDDTREAMESVQRIAKEADASARNVDSVVQANGRIGHALQSMNASSERLSQNAASVASAVSELSESTRGIDGNVVEVKGVSSGVNQQAGLTAEAVHTLTGSAQAIGEVVGVIASIARHTRIVALNARIESERAANGAAFISVAREVKALADRAEEAAHDIEGRIRSIQGDTSGVSGAMDEVRHNVEQMESSMGAIAEAVSAQTRTACSIEGSSLETAQDAESVATLVRESVQLSDSVSAQAQEANTGARDIARVAATVAAASQGVVQQLSKVSDELETTAASAVRIRSHSEGLTRVSRRLTERVAPFQV